MIGELENWRVIPEKVNAVCVRKTGLKVKHGLRVWRIRVDVVRVRRGVDVSAGRWTRVRRARRARGVINWCIVVLFFGVSDLRVVMEKCGLELTMSGDLRCWWLWAAGGAGRAALSA